MTDLPDRLPAALSERLALASHRIYSRMGREVDVAVGGIPFMLASSPEAPHTLETIPQRKDQLDTERDPGEQSLTGWWRRSQSSFHQGAGFLYEPNTDETHNGFWDSSGVNVFEQGDLTLLYQMVTTNIPGTLFSRMRTFNNGTGLALSAVGDGELYRNAGVGAALTSLHAPAGKVIVDGLIASASFYDIATDGTLYEGTVASPGTATTWPCGGAPTRLAWGKHRLWALGGRNLWQPDLSLAGGTAQNPIFTHPNQGWTYTSMAEGPSAMYFAGHDGYSSSIQAVTFDAGGGVPTLSGATITAVLPDGELVQEIAVLAGQFVGIGTNQGFRVGVVQQDASIAYGPLLIQPEGIQACTALTSQGRFFVVGFEVADAEAVVYRIDTGTQLSEGVYPYAKDASCERTGHWTSVASAGTKLYGTTEDGQAWAQSSTELVETGWLQTSRIRFRTTERKIFKYLDVDIEPLEGTLALAGILEGGTTLNLGSYTTQGEVPSEPLAWGGEPMRFGALHITLNRSTAGGVGAPGPTFHAYLVRALPAASPQHLYTLPLMCFDQEQARSGQRYGGDNYCMDRITALMELEKAGQTLIFQDFSDGQNVGRSVMIEGLRFVQNTPRNPSTGNTGGILYLQLRTVEA